MSEAARRATIADVARRAAVSTMTVSRVLNGGDVRAATRQRVEDAIRLLGYRPSQVARGLTTRRSLTLGLLVPDITNPFFPAIVRGAEDVAWREGYVVSLANTVEDVDRERAALQHFEEHRVDGVISCSSRLPDAELGALLSGHSNTILVNRVAAQPGWSSIDIDDVHGAGLATAHLLSSGRRCVALLAGPDNSWSALKRRRGFEAELRARDIEPDPELILVAGALEQGGHAAMHTLLTRRPEVDGVVAYSDVVALGALEAASERGVRVPDDVAIVGNDDVRLASLVTPSLTTVRIDTYTLGRQAATLLIDRLRGGPPRRLTIRPELVVRASAP